MYIIDPLSDLRWAPFVDRHPAACAFHTPGWLRALSHTYGYEPFAVTSSPPESELTDAVPLCRIESWATGRRLVSLPFSDHCQPLVSSETAIGAVVNFVAELSRGEKYKFFELRPSIPLANAAVSDENRFATYYVHWLDLTAPIEAIFNSFQKDSIQRKIRRADRESLQYEEGRSSEIIDKFYGLLLRTRRRHQLPPQPLAWFQNLAKAMGESIQIRVASKDHLPIAAIITLTHRNSIIYKYGCSDERYHATGSVPFLFWRMIQEAKNAAIPLVDFGRSDLDNPGLIRFKDQWGTRKTELTYYRFPAPARAHGSAGVAGKAAKAIFARLPDNLLAIAGKLMYRHIG
jgi:CelD/BcsL family acetyltransferase involved in cellulose biosynthesis